MQLTGQHQWFTAPSGTAGNAISFTQAMTLDASANLVVGGTTAVYTNTNRGNISINGTSTAILALSTGGYGRAYLYTDGSRLDLLNTQNDALTFGTNNTERARIDSSGNLLVGGTTNYGPGKIAPTFNGTTTNGISFVETTDTDGSAYLAFRNSSGVAVGTVTRNGASAVAYNTSSDYRLKHDIAPMTGALAKVAALKPCTYKWKVDGSDGEGFIAHELAEVCPQAVTGEKDAVDADGKPVYQGIDTSFLVATLTAAIQEQQAIIEQLKADVAALKGA